MSFDKIEGVRDAVKISATSTETQNITVKTDGKMIVLSLQGNNYPAGLSVDQARHIARCLLRAAKVAAKRQEGVM